MTASWSSSTLVKVRVSYFLASGYLWGSLSYTPSTMVALNITSALTSTARRAVAVSVEKKGLPVPPPNTAILPSSMARRASLRVKGCATWGMVMEVNTSVGTPSCSSLSETARAFITAAGTAAPEVAAAHHDADLNPQIVGLFHAAADRIHGRLVKAHAFFAAQCFAADLEQNTLIFQCHNPNTTCLYSVGLCARHCYSSVFYNKTRIK